MQAGADLPGALLIFIDIVADRAVLAIQDLPQAGRRLPASPTEALLYRALKPPGGVARSTATSSNGVLRFLDFYGAGLPEAFNRRTALYRIAADAQINAPGLDHRGRDGAAAL
jgi:hypothetical protein